MKNEYKANQIFTDELKRTFPIYTTRNCISCNSNIHFI